MDNIEKVLDLIETKVHYLNPFLSSKVIDSKAFITEREGVS